MAHSTAAYVEGEGGPGNIQNHIADIQTSGLTTVILCSLHVGRKMDLYPNMKIGDLIYNDYTKDLLVSGGSFNPNNQDDIAGWPKHVAQLKQQGSVSKVFISLGGAGGNDPWDVWDFRTIEQMFADDMADTLTGNIQALKANFTDQTGVCAIDGFDIDCEEDVNQSTIVRFCEILFKEGFAVTFCVFNNPNWWQGCMQTLWKQGMKVSWWNLQCYAGGYDNRADLTPWFDALSAVVTPQAAPSFLVPGLSVAGAQDTNDGQCPTGQSSFLMTFSGWNEPRLNGGFLWTYGAVVDNPTICSGQTKLSAYVQAINDALDNKSA